MTSRRPLLILTHALALAAGTTIAAVAFAPSPVIDTRLGAALFQAAEEPDIALAILKENDQDIPERMAMILELYVNAAATERAKSSTYATRALEICNQLRWTNCTEDFLRSMRVGK